MKNPGRLAAGAQVRTARAEKGLSQADLAVAAGVDPGTVSGLETGRRWPRAGQQVRIEKALGWEPGRIERIARGQVQEQVSDPFADVSRAARRAGLTAAELAAFDALSAALRAAREHPNGGTGNGTA